MQNIIDRLEPPPHVGRRACRLLFALVLLAICVNVSWFAILAANPLVISDTWHFLGSVVLPYAHGDFSVGDLFAKRSAMDHSQPLRKLVLLLSYEWFDLDLKFEAAVGVIGALVGLLVLWLMARTARDHRRASPLELLAFAALAAAYLSLSSRVVFSWPLATMSFTNHFFIFMFIWAAWRGVSRPDWKRLLLVIAAGFALAVVADDTGLLTTIAVVLTTLLYGTRAKSARAAVLTSAACVLAYVLYACVYKLISSTPAAGASALPLAARLQELSDQWRHAIEWVTVPLVGSVVHRGELKEWFGSDGPAVALLALLLMVAHLWFWWVAFRGYRNLASFGAVTLMLLFYGLLAGVLVARVSTFGSDYLWQPRYSIVYRWNLVALCLMALGQIAGRSTLSKGGHHSAAGPLKVVASVMAAGLVLVQVPLSVAAWEELPFVKRYHHKQAIQIWELAGDPVTPPARCLSGVVVCRFPVENRIELMDFLSKQRLNVFSPAFQRRYGMVPADPAGAGPEGP